MKYVGWFMAIIAFAAAAGFGMKADRLRQELEQQSAVVTSQEHQIATLRKQMEQIQMLTKDLEKRLADAEQMMASAKKASGPDQAQVPATSPSSAPPEAVQAAKAEPVKPDDNALKDLQKNAAAAQMGVMVDMAYGRLNAKLNLPDDQKNAARDLLIKAAIENQALTVSMMGTANSPAKEYRAKKDALEKSLREDMAKILSPPQMAEWDTYQTTKDQNLYEGLLDGQLAMLAPDLKPEHRTTAKTVLAEELAATLDDFERSDKLFTLTNFNDAQLVALKQGLLRMTPALDEEQYKHLEGFVSKVEAVFAQMAGNKEKK